jgi:hypothetical protein
MANGTEEIELTLKLTRDEWCELTNAVASKATLIERGDYGEANDEEEYDPHAWAQELWNIYYKVTPVLDEKGVTY